MKLFKNFKTKKQLQAEIERLKAIHEKLPMIEIEQMEIRELCASTIVCNELKDDDYAEIQAMRIVSESIRRKMKPFIEFSEEDSPEGKIIRGKLRVVGKEYET